MRSLQQIIDRIMDEKAIHLELGSLQVGSATGIWQWWVDVVARVLLLQEQIFYSHRSEIEAIKKSLIVGREGWYIQQMRAFQYGDLIEWDSVTHQAYYTVPDASKRIIRYVAVVGYQGRSLIKVAKDQGGLPAPLAAAEISAARNYLRRIQVAGAQIDLASYPADLIELWADIYYDGLLAVSQVRADVEQAVNTYLAELDFNGYLLRNRLIDVIQAVPGVRDVEIHTLNAASQGVIRPIGRVYQPRSGYFQVAGTAPLSNTLSLIPQ